MAADDPPHGGITAQTVGIVHVVVATKTAKEGLAELSRHAVPPVLAGAAVSEKTPGNLGQAKGFVKLPVGEQPGVRGDYRTFAIQSAALVVPPVPSIALSISFMVVSVLELPMPS